MSHRDAHYQRDTSCSVPRHEIVLRFRGANVGIIDNNNIQIMEFIFLKRLKLTH